MLEPAELAQQVPAETVASATGQKTTPPRRWVWSAMEPADRQQRIGELGLWVDWLIEYHEMPREVPRCWYRHRKVREILTALYLGWVRTYAGDPAKVGTLGEIEWISRLHTLAPKLAAPACLESHQETAPPKATGEGLQDWLDDDPEWVTAPVFHPAEAEANRLAAELAAAERAKAERRGGA
ncbi:hypothetical protein ACGF07_32015 [Kitasatospora sp. NPDC048194]|uniref:hypothetical protein n=1 Tax=Kitasatospora sp. NPDC048194 TaxID=3364045 RepID=UPI0037229B07